MKMDSVPILLLRGQAIILDADLATLYGVPTKRLNEQVKRNQERFPDDCLIKLAPSEFANLRSQIATSSIKSFFNKDLQTQNWGGRRFLPLAFTEHGALMAANVLNSPPAQPKQPIGFG